MLGVVFRDVCFGKQCFGEFLLARGVLFGDKLRGERGVRGKERKWVRVSSLWLDSEVCTRYRVREIAIARRREESLLEKEGGGEEVAEGGRRSVSFESWS